MIKKLFNFYDKLSLYKKLAIPNIIILTFGFIYILSILNQTNKISKNNLILQNKLLPMVQLTISNNNLLKKISESFTFAVLSSEKDLLLNVNKNSLTIIENTKKLASYNIVKIDKNILKVFDEYLEISYKVSASLINNNSLVFSSSSEVQESLIKYRIVNKQFKTLENNLKDLIKLNTHSTNTQINNLILNTIITAGMLYLFVFLISYFIYSDFKNKFLLFLNHLNDLKVSKVKSIKHIAKDEFGVLSSELNDIFDNFEKKYNALDNEKLKIETIAKTDKLTNLFNRHYVDELLVEIKTKRQPYSLIIIDIDNFKSVNDTYGHLVGDDVLVRLSSILTSKLRKHDILARWGGEEFILLIPGNSESKLLLLCEKLRKSIFDAKFDTVGNITISLGCTVFDNFNVEIKDAIKNADDGLYEAKKTGKNKTVLV